MPTVRAYAVAAILCLVGTGCGKDDDFDPPGFDPPDGECIDGQSISRVGYFCCDPDQQTRCECPGYWVCTEDFPTEDCGGGAGGSGKVCRQEFPDMPGAGEGWGDCYEEEFMVICQGDAETFPDDGGGPGWDCTTQGEFVICEHPADDYPDNGDGVGWNCTWNEGVRVCEETSSDGGDWECISLENGDRECTQEQPELPDDGSWECQFSNGADGSGDDAVLCDGHSDGGAGNGWDCYSEVELYERCRDEEPSYPDDGGDEEWNCYFDEFGRQICTTAEYEDEGGDGPCPIGAARWCDGPTFCGWGKQFCVEGNVWGACHEEDGDRPDTSCACRHFYFNPDCCEDPLTCLIPEEHALPQCESDGGLCGYCFFDGDCDEGLCLETSRGATLCGRDCTGDGDCPDGFACQDIRDYHGQVVSQQCAPTQANGCDQ